MQAVCSLLPGTVAFCNVHAGIAMFGPDNPGVIPCLFKIFADVPRRYLYVIEKQCVMNAFPKGVLLCRKRMPFEKHGNNGGSVRTFGFLCYDAGLTFADFGFLGFSLCCFRGIMRRILYIILKFAIEITKEAFMRRIFIMALGASVLLSGCGTYAGSGAYAGATLGSVLGSAVGGITGGYRGSDIGTLVGMAGGAAVGGAIGAQADKARQNSENERFERKYLEHRASATSQGSDYAYRSGSGDADGSGFDPTGGGDDVLYDFNGSDYTGNYTASRPEDAAPPVAYDGIDMPSGRDVMYPLEVRNVRFVDDNQDRRLSAGELCKVIFEVYNVSQASVYDVQPMVVETTGNKHVLISNSIHVEKIEPGKGVRYTAMVKAGKRLKNDGAVFRVYAVQGNNNVVSDTSEFNIQTSRK